MIVCILLVLTANQLTNAVGVYKTVDRITCNSNGFNDANCLVPKASLEDLILLEAKWIGKNPPKICAKKRISLHRLYGSVYLNVPKGCRGEFEIFKAECGVADESSESFRIINGHDASSCKQFPWMARITGHLNCGASILNRNHLLTAAHCVTDSVSSLPKVSKFTVYTGSHNKSNAQISKVDKIFPHERYDDRNVSAKYANDIAVVRLKEDLKFDDCRRPICLEKNINLLEVPEVTKSCLVSGWGLADKDTLLYGFGYPELLNWVNVTITSSSVCNETFHIYYVPGGQICAQARDSSFGGHCRGDSGGPLICRREGEKWHEYGVVSLAYRGCGVKPGAYSSVPFYYNWIMSKINSP